MKSSCENVLPETFTVPFDWIPALIHDDLTLRWAHNLNENLYTYSSCIARRHYWTTLATIIHRLALETGPLVGWRCRPITESQSKHGSSSSPDSAVQTHITFFLSILRSNFQLQIFYKFLFVWKDAAALFASRSVNHADEYTLSFCLRFIYKLGGWRQRAHTVKYFYKQFM